jgi:group II intron reverse transcriptase/maturase
MAWLQEAYRKTRKDGATGVDGQTAENYAATLCANLQSLLDRMKSGNYKAPPVKRAHIPKGNGESRPIGIPTFEDKIAQRAVAMVLEPILEQDFYDCSFGFRPRRSAHQAHKALRDGIMAMHGGCWLIDADISKCFDTMDRKLMREFLRQRVRDGVVDQMVGKWLNAGVMEAGQWQRNESGTPQGGVISPLLSNLYLHEALDKWFCREVCPRLKGKAFLVRFADDFVMGFEQEEDARRVFAVLPKRFEKHGLRIHSEKTRLLDFRKPGGRERKGKSTFDFLGFRHYWGRSLRGYMVVKAKTAAPRLSRALKVINEWCRTKRHEPISWQQQQLRSKLLGHYAYYGIPCNQGSMNAFLHVVMRIWRKWLCRRSRKSRMNWEVFNRLLQQYPLPQPRVVHAMT